MTLTITSRKLAQALVKDPSLLSKWKELSTALNSSPQDEKGWDDGIKTRTLPYTDLFTEMINIWLSENPTKTLKDFCTILETTGFLNLASNLPETLAANEDSVIVSKSITSVLSREAEDGLLVEWTANNCYSKPIANFTGRKKQLKYLKSLYRNGDNLAFIHGLGSIGKTEICKKFVDKMLNPSSSKRLKRTLFHKGQPRCLVLTGDTLDDSSIGDLFAQTIQPILLDEGCSTLIFIIDNLNRNNEGVKTLVRQIRRHSKGFVIVTSQQDPSILDHAGKPIQLNCLEQSEARLMIQKSLDNVSVREADSICEDLGNFPGVLQQVISYIKVQRENNALRPKKDDDVSGFMQIFKQNKIKRGKIILKKEDVLNHSLSACEHEYRMTLEITVDMMIKKITGDGNLILNIVCLMQPGRIGVRFLEDICLDYGLKENEFYIALKTVRDYNLVQAVDGELSINPLIQHILSEKNPTGFSKKCCHALLKVWAKRQVTGQGLNKYERQHVTKLCKFAFDMDFSFIHNPLNDSISDDKILLMDIKSTMANELHSGGKLSESLELQKEVLSLKNDYICEAMDKTLSCLSKVSGFSHQSDNIIKESRLIQLSDCFNDTIQIKIN